MYFYPHLHNNMKQFTRDQTCITSDHIVPFENTIFIFLFFLMFFSKKEKKNFCSHSHEHYNVREFGIRTLFLHTGSA